MNIHVSSHWRLAAAGTAAALIAAVSFTAHAAPTRSALAARPSAVRPASSCTHANEALVERVYREVYNDGKTNLVDRYYASDFVQHDPTIGAGRGGLVASLTKNRPRHAIVTIKNILAQGDLVVVHSQISATPADAMSGVASMDRYRIEHGQIAEHWNSTQQVPAKTASGNSMFSSLYPGPSNAYVSPAQQNANKQLVEKIAVGLFTGHEAGLLDTYFDPGYIQHNPLLASGAAALKAVLPFLPAEVLHVRAAITDGQYVYLYEQNVTADQPMNTDFDGQAISDIYRLVRGKIVEHWDVVQTVPSVSANGTSMFGT